MDAENFGSLNTVTKGIIAELFAVVLSGIIQTRKDVEHSAFKNLNSVTKGIVAELFARVLVGKIKVRRDIEYHLVTVMLNSEAKVYYTQHYRDRNPFGEGAKCQAIIRDLIVSLNSRSSELMVNNVSMLYLIVFLKTFL